jgi:peptide/bleomycin uptake transporter
MFRSFFFSRKWLPWSLGGSLIILWVVWYQVQLSVKINDWYKNFYDSLQQALSKPNSVTLDQYMALIFTFVSIATLSIVLAVLLEFFVKHFVFRWRTAMTNFYVDHWQKLRHIEGASQRVQEDTMRFATIIQKLGVTFIKSILVLVAFLPILWELSKKVPELPWIGAVDHSLVFVAAIWSIFGTLGLALIGIKLPGLEFNNQRVEAAFRKELVLGEDDELRAAPPTLKSLFDQVRTNHFRLYFHYMYFDVAKWGYLQFGVMVPMIALGPAVVTGAITFGMWRQIANVFDKVENSFQYLVSSWTDIVELISVYKRLRAFEVNVLNDAPITS